MTHKEEHFGGSAIVKDFVIGMSDGLTVPFALAAGLSGAVDNATIVITAGLAEIAAGAIAMGLGGYLAGKTETEHYYSERRREYWEVDHIHDREIAETKEIFAEFGVSESVQETVAMEIAKDKDKWVDFMMRFELGLEEPQKNRAVQSASVIGFSYVIGGIIPLSAYFFTTSVNSGLLYSCIITTICLLIFGVIKSKFTGQPLVRGALRTVIIGALAAGSAFLIAKMITG